MIFTEALNSFHKTQESKKLNNKLMNSVKLP